MESGKMRVRNDGVDLLRVVSMAMIVLLHVLGCGGILAATEAGTAAYRAAWLWEIAAYGAVDCYALISGFVGYAKPLRPASLVLTWLRVWFWSVLPTVAFVLCMPEAVGRRDFILSLFPVLARRYWYATSYFLTCLLTPLLKALLRRGSRRSAGLCLLLFSCGSSLFITLRCEETFYLKVGGGVFLLAWLYLLGGYVGKYGVGEKGKPLFFFGAYAAAVFATWTAFLYGETRLVCYASPTVLLGSVCLFLCFRNLSVGEKGRRFLRVASPPTFGVYLLHTQPFIWTYLLKGSFAFAGGRGAIFLTGVALLAALLIDIFCSAADTLRAWLFRKCRIEERVGAVFRREK